MSEFPKKLVINQAQTDIGFLDEIGIFTHIQTKTLAQEVIDRWNSHDALLKACKIALIEMQNVRPDIFRIIDTSEYDNTICLLGKSIDEAAIAQAKKS